MKELRKEVRTICQGCYMECGVVVHLMEGKIVKIAADSDHPINTICPKGRNFASYIYHPDRIKYPLKKTKNGWQRISWDEALNITAKRLLEIKEEFGPTAILVAASPTGRNIFSCLIGYAIGTPNYMGTTDLCEGPNRVADAVTIGDIITRYPTDIIRSDDFDDMKCILIWGFNPSETHKFVWDQTIRIKNEGTKLIVVDPRKTKAASKADLWLQVKPGSDAALGLAMLNVIINEGLYDKEFVDKWCVDFEKLKERVREYPPERATDITRIPKEKIREAAIMYTMNKPAHLFCGVGLCYQTNSVQTARVIDILIAITGNIDVSGGNLLRKRVEGYVYNTDLRYLREFELPEETKAKMLGTREFPLWAGPDSFMSTNFCHIPAAIKAMLYGNPYPIKAMLHVDYNMVLSLPNSYETWKALDKLEFMVSIQNFLTPTSEHADIILPFAQWPERNEVCDASWGIGIRRKAIEPVGECWDKINIYLELAKRMKLEAFSQWENVECFMEFKLRKMGITFEDLKEKNWILAPEKFKVYEEKGFNTPSKKVELYSSIFEKYGYDPLPYHRETPESEINTPELAKKYPLILITGARSMYYVHTDGRQLSWARKMIPDPPIEIHPEAAKKRGIKNGNWLWIENSRGKRIKARAKVTENIHPKVVSIMQGWWFPEKQGPEHGCFEANANVLTFNDPPYDTIAGTPYLSGLLCEVFPITK